MESRFKILLCATLISGSLNAQSFFKRVAAPHGTFSVMADSVTLQTTKNEWRPEINLVSYAVPENSLLTGIGISYQHLKWDAGKWKSQWSVNGLVWSKTPLDGGKARLAVGIAFGVFNNLLLIGGATDMKNAFPTIGLGVNLNN